MDSSCCTHYKQCATRLCGVGPVWLLLDEILESIQDGFYAVDAEWRVLCINRRAEEFWGIPREQLLGRVVWDIFPQTIGSDLHNHMLHAAETHASTYTEYWSSVMQAWLLVKLSPIPSGGLAVYFLDITETKRVEGERDELLRASQSRAAELMAIVESNPDALYISDAAQITLANARARALFGCTSIERLSGDFSLIAQHDQVRDAITGESLPGERWPFRRALRSGEKCEQDLLVYHAGSAQDVLLPCTAAPVRVAGAKEEIIGAVCINTDILLSRQRELIQALIEAQEEERRALAYDLHDGLLQYVMAAHAHMETYRDLGEEDSPDQAKWRAEELTQTVDYLRHAVVECRRLVNGLRFIALENLGLAGAVEQLLTEEKRRADWAKAELVHNVGGRRFHPRLEAAIYRVCQEALTNVRRHGQAHQVRVSILAGDAVGESGQQQEGLAPLTYDLSFGFLTLEVRDWGCGFVLTEASSDPRHIGLQGMAERVRMAGGNFQVRSTPGKGTAIQAIFPVSIEEGTIAEDTVISRSQENDPQ